jgi:hypothetical protein
MKPPLPHSPRAWAALLGPWPPAYERLCQQLAQTAWICHGTVVCRSLLRQRQGRPVQHGPYYLWTCKVQGQTQCVALSQAQYRALAQAIKNQRKVSQILEKMQRLTLQTILRKIPGVKKRK